MGFIAAAGLGLQALGAISNLVAQRQAANDHTQYQALQTQSTINNYIQSLNAIHTRYTQESDATAFQKQEIAIQNMKARATAEASAASNGVEGSSLDMLFEGYDRATAIDNYIASRNLRAKELQSYQEMLGYRASALSSIYNQTPYQSNSTGAFLSGFGGLLSSYADMKWRQNFKSTSSKGLL